MSGGGGHHTYVNAVDSDWPSRRRVSLGSTRKCCPCRRRAGRTYPSGLHTDACWSRRSSRGNSGTGTGTPLRSSATRGAVPATPVRSSRVAVQPTAVPSYERGKSMSVRRESCGRFYRFVSDGSRIKPVRLFPVRTKTVVRATGGRDDGPYDKSYAAHRTCRSHVDSSRRFSARELQACTPRKAQARQASAGRTTKAKGRHIIFKANKKKKKTFQGKKKSVTSVVVDVT